MIPKNERYSFKNGIPKRSIVTPFFSLRFDTKNTEGLRLGVVVGKRVDKHAVARNKLKRIFSKAVLKAFRDEKIVGSYVFYLKSSLKEIAEDEFDSILVKAIAQIK